MAITQLGTPSNPNSNTQSPYTLGSPSNPFPTVSYPTTAGTVQAQPNYVGMDANNNPIFNTPNNPVTSSGTARDTSATNSSSASDIATKLANLPQVSQAYAGTAGGQSALSNIQALANAVGVWSASDETAAEQDPSYLQAIQNQKLGMANDIVTAGEAGGFMNTQYSGQAALQSTGAGFVGQGGALDQQRQQYDMAVQSALGAAKQAIRTGKIQDLQAAEDAYNTAEKASQDIQTFQTNQTAQIAATVVPALYNDISTMTPEQTSDYLNQASQQLGVPVAQLSSQLLTYKTDQDKATLLNSASIADILAKTSSGGTVNVPGVGDVTILGTGGTAVSFGGKVYSQINGVYTPLKDSTGQPILDSALTPDKIFTSLLSYDPTAAMNYLSTGKIDLTDNTNSGNGVVKSSSGNSYDMSTYASDPSYASSLQNLMSSIPTFTSGTDITNYIQKTQPNSPLTADNIMTAAYGNGINPEELTAVIQKESNLGTSNVAKVDNNPGGITWSKSYQDSHPDVTKGSARLTDEGGNYVKFKSLQDGTNAVAQQLANRKTTATSQTSQGAPGTTGSPQIDTSAPGYSSTPLAKAGGLTQAAVDKAAIAYATTGTMPSVGLGSTGAAGMKRDAIQNRAAELDANGTISSNKAKLSSLTQSLNQQTTYQNTMERSINTVDDNLQILQNLADKVNKNDSPLINEAQNLVNQKVIGSGDLASYKAAIQTVRSEYATILARGQQTDTTRKEAATLIPDNITKSQLLQVVSVLKAEGQNVSTEAQNQVDDVNNQIDNIIGGGNLYKNNNDPLGLGI